MFWKLLSCVVFFAEKELWNQRSHECRMCWILKWPGTLAGEVHVAQFVFWIRAMPEEHWLFFGTEAAGVGRNSLCWCSKQIRAVNLWAESLCHSIIVTQLWQIRCYNEGFANFLRDQTFPRNMQLLSGFRSSSWESLSLAAEDYWVLMYIWNSSNVKKS